MNKLFKLKEWLTVEGAARHLSILFGEEVTESDLLRLALDGHLKLSVNFVNHGKAKRGKIVDYGHTEWREFSAEMVSMMSTIPDEAKGKPIPYMTSLNIDNNRYLNLDDEVTTVKGVWDLPLIGNEKLDVEQRYQILTNGPDVKLSTLDGAFIEGEEGVMCQLQDSFDDNEFQDGSQAQLLKIEESIVCENVENLFAERLRQTHKEMRKKYLERRASRPSSENYYPAASLPNDSVLVVRTKALAEFEKKVRSSEGLDVGEKEVNGKSEAAFLNIIGALCDLYWRAAKPDQSRINQSEIIAALETYGGFSGLSERNLKEKLSKAIKAIRNE